MIAAKPKHSDIYKDEAVSAENFVERVRQKMPTPNHKFKKTDRINLQSRYPEYREESAEERTKPATPIKIDLKMITKKGYDEEFLEKLRRFLDFCKRIFKTGLKK